MNKLSTATFFLCATCASVALAAGHPNIITIVADDLGYADMGFLPQSPADVKTPGIDRLAGQVKK